MNLADFWSQVCLSKWYLPQHQERGVVGMTKPQGAKPIYACLTMSGNQRYQAAQKQRSP